MAGAEKRGEKRESPAAWLERSIREFCGNSPDNSLKNTDDEKAWGEPLVGFSSGADPLYDVIKEDVGPFYMTPSEVFSRTFPDMSISPDQLTVISWILPQNKSTKADNGAQTVYPSERWARAKRYGEVLNTALRRYVVEIMETAGSKAVAPLLTPFWSWNVSERRGIASNWSERHAAHVSGLGTFGLCDGLITPVGKAMRCGSVIAGIAIPPTPRPYTDHHEYCLHFSHGTCDKCIKRCPAGAISEQGHDKTKCSDYLKKVTSEYVRDHYGIETDVCGLCQTAVPCESRIPAKPRK
ncbi:MAG: epoxyqueuosine reductase [Syntrophobacter sp.]